MASQNLWPEVSLEAGRELPTVCEIRTLSHQGPGLSHSPFVGLALCEFPGQTLFTEEKKK